jgi:hypothetical protein
MQQEHKVMKMAKAPVKTPAAPKMTLKPGEKKKLDIKATKLKIAKINALKEELGKLESTQRMAGRDGILSTQFANKALTAKMAEFHAMLDAEEADLRAQLKQAAAEVVKSQSKSLSPLIQTIQKECSQALAAYKATDKVLLRGLKKNKSNSPAYVGRSWNERQTMNSDPEGQRVFDYALQKMGISALRSNSIFATTDSSQAGQYGNLYVIIPKNGFQFSWSVHEDDMVIDDVSVLYKEVVIDKIMNNIDKLVQKNKMSDGASGDDWQEVLRYEGYEFAMQYLRDNKYPAADLKKITLDALIDYKHIKDNIAPTNKDFNKALISGNEVLINGEYYAFEFEKFKDILSALLGLSYLDSII